MADARVTRESAAFAAEPVVSALLAATRRRLLTVSVLILGATLTLFGLPLWLGIALIIDVVAPPGGVRRWSVCRAVLAFAFYLLCEVLGVAAASLLWLLSPLLRSRWTALHYRLQRAWGVALTQGLLRIYDMKLEVEGAALLDGRPILIFCRHVSQVDGVLLQYLVCRDAGYTLAYVLKHELLADPCLDIVGNRLPNVFVRRDGAHSAVEASKVAGLISGIGPGQGVMIFPEGTRFSPARKAAALARIQDPALRARAEAMSHMLPPRPGGPLALLEHNRAADVIFCAHTGLEGARAWPQFIAGHLVGQPLRVRFWRAPLAEIPADPAARLAWLYGWWETLDAWVEGALSPDLS